MRPSGLGLRLKSRQLQVPTAALAGDNCPFVALPSKANLVVELEAAFGLSFARLLNFRTLIGLRLLGLALLNSGFSSEVSSSMPSSMGGGVATRLLERVVGPI
jgi:hypothetical protein